MNAKDDFIKAYRSCSNNRKAIERDTRCGCYKCQSTFLPAEISRWLPDASDETALCPVCGSDAVLPKSAGFPLDTDFLTAMNDFWRMDRPDGL